MKIVKKLSLTAVVLGLGVLILTNNANASTLANIDIPIDGFGSAYIDQTASFCFDAACGNYSTGSPNQYFSFTSGPAFDNLVTTLTNGTDDFFGYSIQTYLAGGTSSSVGPESVLFASSPGQANGIDFAGHSISEIDLTVINQISSPGSDPNGDGIWTDYNFTVNMQVMSPSPVPLPATAWLFGSGLLGLLAMARRSSV